MAKRITRQQELAREAQERGLIVMTYAPGDGVTRYRFFRVGAGGGRQDYFGPEDGIYTALGLKEAYAFLHGYSHGSRSNPRRLGRRNPGRGFTINNADREQWVDNDESLYNWWRSSRLSKREFIRENKTELDAAIRRAVGR